MNSKSLRHAFGLALRAARERQAISVAEISAATKVDVDLWTGLEAGDLSGWPLRLYARSWVRDYATIVGLDPHETVDEFCRLFPEHGDRRSKSLLQQHASTIQHSLNWEDELEFGGQGRNRRTGDQTAGRSWIDQHKQALAAAIVDLMVPLMLATLVSHGFDQAFWRSLAISALGWHVAGTLAGRSLGTTASRWRGWAVCRSAARRLVSSRASS